MTKQDGVTLRPARLALASALLLLAGAGLRERAPASAPPASAPTEAEFARTPGRPHPDAFAESPAPVAEDSPAPPLPPGVTGSWIGRFDAPLASLAPTPAPEFTPPVDLSIPVSADERIPVRLRRFDVAEPDGGVFTGEVPGQPGGTVVLSYVGRAQAGVVYLPGQNRSFVINGGDDGSIRVVSTDLSRAPGCAPAPPLPPTTRP